ncbi:LOW QUALITY PROTEIN: hypothetical protein Dda_8818 [Drechslerella dactyloides]|uniref:RNase III domain-containing protein n=1 Tax=Drechslerella dactyloides TaxID=74499 RepID=A0AAD6IRQ2_DREDA|nr:LOW QUALITY PROTEIN: hypothetical protein Dda_8818 [Drechslerella dactyloides]
MSDTLKKALAMNQIEPLIFEKTTAGLAKEIAKVISGPSFEDRRLKYVQSSSSRQVTITKTQLAQVFITIPSSARDIAPGWMERVKIAWETLLPESYNNHFVTRASPREYEGCIKEPDYSSGLVRATFPSLIIEVGLSQSYAKLLKDKDLWLVGSGGQVKAVVLIRVEKFDPITVSLELWKNDSVEKFHSILKVAPGFLLPQIVREDLRASALMDQTGRKPLGVRNLNHVGRFAYNLAVATYLAATWPGNPNLKQLQAVLTADKEIAHLSHRFGLLGATTFPTAAPPTNSHKHNPLVEVFYAWIGAVFTEQGIDAVQDFVHTLIGANMKQILDGVTVAITAIEGAKRKAVLDVEAEAQGGISKGSENVEMHETRKRKARMSLGESIETDLPAAEHRSPVTPKRRKLAAPTSFLYSMKACGIYNRSPNRANATSNRPTIPPAYPSTYSPNPRNDSSSTATSRRPPSAISSKTSSNARPCPGTNSTVPSATSSALFASSNIPRTLWSSDRYRRCRSADDISAEYARLTSLSSIAVSTVLRRERRNSWVAGSCSASDSLVEKGEFSLDRRVECVAGGGVEVFRARVALLRRVVSLAAWRRVRMDDLDDWSRCEVRAARRVCSRSVRAWMAKRMVTASRTWGRSGSRAGRDVVGRDAGREEERMRSDGAERTARALERRVARLPSAFWMRTMLRKKSSSRGFNGWRVNSCPRFFSGCGVSGVAGREYCAQVDSSSSTLDSQVSAICRMLSSRPLMSGRKFRRYHSSFSDTNGFHFSSSSSPIDIPESLLCRFRRRYAFRSATILEYTFSDSSELRETSLKNGRSTDSGSEASPSRLISTEFESIDSTSSSASTLGASCDWTSVVEGEPMVDEAQSR